MSFLEVTDVNLEFLILISNFFHEYTLYKLTATRIFVK